MCATAQASETQWEQLFKFVMQPALTQLIEHGDMATFKQRRDNRYQSDTSLVIHIINISNFVFNDRYNGIRKEIARNNTMQ